MVMSRKKSRFMDIILCVEDYIEASESRTNFYESPQNRCKVLTYNEDENLYYERCDIDRGYHECLDNLKFALREIGKTKKDIGSIYTFYENYKKMELNSIVKNIPENKQPKLIKQLLMIYNPDILVITGHDGMIKKGRNYSDIYNYMNSRFFVNTVKRAREHEYGKNLVIFAGACQSYFEALINAGANFASSPARVLLDFADPLIVAEKIATTDSDCYITINDIADDLRDGKDGVGGIGAKGKKQKVTLM